MTILLTPGKVTLYDLASVFWCGAPARLDPACDAAIARGAARIAEIAAGEAPVYGVNTGFGKLASIRIRITSYNVCYTKLLRGSYDIFLATIVP